MQWWCGCGGLCAERWPQLEAAEAEAVESEAAAAAGGALELSQVTVDAAGPDSDSEMASSSPTPSSEVVCASADAWQYIAEGALNLALRYAGSAPELRGTVLRVRKRNPEASGGGGAGAGSPWVESLKFVDAVVLPLLGRRYVQPAVEVPLREGFMHELAAHIEDARPQARRKHGLDLDLKTALLMLDNTALPLPSPASTAAMKADKNAEAEAHAEAGTEAATEARTEAGTEAEAGTIAEAEAGPAVCFELKVKCGFVPATCPLVTLDVKRRVDRFTMHQQLKNAQGKLDSLSRYSPVDLFSYDRERVVAALEALVATPQNNFRMFVDGRMAYPDAEGHGSRAALEALLAEHGVAGGSADTLVATLAGVLLREPLLRRLQDMQMLDDCDIEGVWPAFQAMEARGEHMRPLADGAALLPREPPSRAPQTPEEQHEAVSRFMLACTAKDCSVMIVTRAAGAGAGAGGGEEADEDEVADGEGEGDSEGEGAGELSALPVEADKKEGRTVVRGFEGVDYSIAVVDLDPKPISKMQHYYELDQQVAKHYKKALDEGTLL